MLVVDPLSLKIRRGSKNGKLWRGYGLLFEFYLSCWRLVYILYALFISIATFNKHRLCKFESISLQVHYSGAQLQYEQNEKFTPLPRNRHIYKCSPVNGECKIRWIINDTTQGILIVLIILISVFSVQPVHNLYVCPAVLLKQPRTHQKQRMQLEEQSSRPGRPGIYYSGMILSSYLLYSFTISIMN